jgi:hypothetical protein
VVKILYVCRQPFHESLQSPFPIGWSVSSWPPILKFRRICSRLSHLRSMLRSSISGALRSSLDCRNFPTSGRGTDLAC